MRLEILPPKNAGTDADEAVNRRSFIGNLDVHVRPVLAQLRLAHLLQEEPGFSASRITQDRVAPLPVTELIAKGSRPEIDHGSEIVHVYPDLTNVIQRHPDERSPRPIPQAGTRTAVTTTRAAPVLLSAHHRRAASPATAIRNDFADPLRSGVSLRQAGPGRFRCA
jgi:hypothetical protein